MWLNSSGKPSRGGTGDPLCAVAAACANLMEALAELSAARDQLDNDQAAGASEESISATLDRIRNARGRCEESAETVLETRPKTTQEAIIRSDALSSYLTKVDVDQMTRQTLFERDAAGRDPGGSALQKNLLPRHAPWRSWLKLGSDTSSN